MYKAVAFDMDGTLLNNQREILPETLSVIEQLINKGIKVILVTGRHHSLVEPYYHQLRLNAPQICCNGTYLYDFAKKEAIDPNPITQSEAFELLKLVRKNQIHTLIYTESFMFYEELDDHLEGLFNWVNSVPESYRPEIKQIPSFEKIIEESQAIYKFATSSHDIPRLKLFSEEVEQTGIYECEWSWVNRADVAKKGNSKGNGLIKWAKNQGIDVSEIIAFGDNYNDVSMLKVAGLGVVMGNADDEIKALGDKVIGDNNSPAIANTLSEIFGLDK